jgi:hypothetical protein
LSTTLTRRRFDDDDFESIVGQRVSAVTEYRPLLLRPQHSADMPTLSALLRDPHIDVYDTLLTQLGELVKIRNPKQRFSQDSLTAAARDRLDGTAAVNYGVWVYYPWARRLVHLLGEPEFVAVRTSRNQYKITPAEQHALAAKKNWRHWPFGWSDNRPRPRDGTHLRRDPARRLRHARAQQPQ